MTPAELRRKIEGWQLRRFWQRGNMWLGEIELGAPDAVDWTSAYASCGRQRVGDRWVSLSPPDNEDFPRFAGWPPKPMTLQEVGACFGVGPERARQVVTKALRKLRFPHRVRTLSAWIERQPRSLPYENGWVWEPIPARRRLK